MMSKLLQINGYTWDVFFLDERTLIINPVDKTDTLSKIHETTRLLEQSDISEIVDLIPAYESIALVYDRFLNDIQNEIKSLQKRISSQSLKISSPKKYEILVCYQMGLDWDKVESHTGLNREEIIQKHSKAEYKVAIMGFTPGFVYLHGMNDAISTPRRQNPRIRIPAGSVGIGGSQTGFYGLESPGGWQIIGRTPKTYFHTEEQPPTPFRLGDIITFVPISKQDFEDRQKQQKTI